MAADKTEPGRSPESAFAALGDQTRIAILRSLGQADGPLAFSELQGRVGYDAAGNFSYHLDQLTGHFIRKTEEGYELRRPGERILEAVLSGAVTEAPSIERTQVERSCPYCGNPVAITYSQERVSGFCTECRGVYTGSGGETQSSDNTTSGLLGQLPLPPAGVQGRTMQEIERAAWTWGVRDMIALANAVCPRCSSTLQQSPDACVDHDPSDGICPACQNRHAVQLRSRCTNCIFEHEGAFVVKFMTNTAFLSFITDHGLNPITDHWEFGWTYTEDVISTEPFRARFAFDIDDETLTVTVGTELTVTDVTRNASTGRN